MAMKSGIKLGDNSLEDSDRSDDSEAIRRKEVMWV